MQPYSHPPTVNRLLAIPPAMLLLLALLSVLGGGAGKKQFLLAAILLLLPPLGERIFSLRIPDAFHILYVLFIFGSNICGELCGFYSRFAIWDLILHTMAGVLFAAAGWSLFSGIVGERKHMRFAALTGFCFSVTASALWEFFEYAADRLTGADMQKDTLLPAVYSALAEQTLNAHVDVGLTDTMEDMLLGAVGAFIFAAATIHHPQLADCLRITRKKSKTSPQKVDFPTGP